jgi:hypothetical protein
MNKEFIPYEEALALKELGFDEKCIAMFSEGKYIQIGSYFNNSQMDKSGYCATPLYQQAFRWFRERYNLLSTEMYDRGLDKGRLPIVHSYSFSIKDLNTFVDTYSKPFKSYEEAQDACLRKLIEMINQNKDE